LKKSLKFEGGDDEDSFENDSEISGDISRD